MPRKTKTRRKAMTPMRTPDTARRQPKPVRVVNARPGAQRPRIDARPPRIPGRQGGR